MLAADVVAAIAQRLAEHAGLELPAWVVEARAAARIELLGLAPADYVALLDTGRGAGELAALIEAVRVGESRLFRHRTQLAALTDVVVPALRARGQLKVRVWSAGCAAGEEPYTLAIVLARAMPECAIAIVATDVSAEAVAMAETARYARSQLQYVPAEYRDAFVDDGDAITVQDRYAQLVRFERANLLDGRRPPAGSAAEGGRGSIDGATPRGCDLVWCRNVLIYFTADARRRAVDRLVGATVSGGFVFVGYSETLRDVAELDAVRASDAVFYVKRDAGRPEAAVAPAAVAVRPEIRRIRTPTSVPVHVPSAVPAAVLDRKSAPAIAMPTAADDRTPPPIVFALSPPSDDTLVLHGRPAVALVTAELSARLAQRGLRSLTVDLDAAELLDDELAPILRRARAAARAAGVILVLRATRTGARRYLARHDLDEDVA